MKILYKLFNWCSKKIIVKCEGNGVKKGEQNVGSDIQFWILDVNVFEY